MWQQYHAKIFTGLKKKTHNIKIIFGELKQLQKSQGTFLALGLIPSAFNGPPSFVRNDSYMQLGVSPEYPCVQPKQKQNSTQLGEYTL